MLLKVLKIVLICVLLWLGMSAVILTFPVFFIIWGVYNRKNINIWLSLLLALMSIIVSSQFYILNLDILDSKYNKEIIGIGLYIHPFFSFGASLLALPFILIRLISFSQTLTTRRKSIYIFGFWVLFLQTLPFLLSIMRSEYVPYEYSFGRQIFLAASALIWFLLVIFLFIKHTEDNLISDLQRYALSLRNMVRNSE